MDGLYSCRDVFRFRDGLGFDDRFLDSNGYGLAAMATGYLSPREVWEAMARRPRLAVVDSLTVPRRANWTFGAPPPFRLRGFYLEDGSFRPVPVTLRDPQTGRLTRLTVIGVLSETALLELSGIWTSQSTARAAFGDERTARSATAGAP